MASSYTSLPAGPPAELTFPKTQFADRHDIDLLNKLNEATRRAYAKLPNTPRCLKMIWNAGGQIAQSWVLNPIQAGIEAFFKTEQNEFYWAKPLVDLAMIPGNALIVLSNAILPLAPDGRLGVPLVAGIFPLTETLQLVGDLWNKDLRRIHRFKNPFAALMGLTVSYYSALLAYIFAYNLFYDNDRKPLPYPLMPHDLFITVYSMTFQSSSVILSYVAGINGYVFGRDSVLYRSQECCQLLWLRVQNDCLKRCLERIDKLSTAENAYAVAKSIDHNYQIAYASKKDWFLIDFVSQLLQSLCRIPANMLNLAAYNAQAIPLIKGQLYHRQLIVPNDSMYYPKPLPTELPWYYPLGITTLAVTVGWISASPPVESQNIRPLPPYDEMLDAILLRDYRGVRPLVDAFLSYLMGKIKPTQLRLLRADLVKRYLLAVFCFRRGMPLPEPLMPHCEKDRPARGYFSLKNLREAHRDPVIAKMLRGDFSDCTDEQGRPVLSLEEKARRFNERLYTVICYKEAIPTPEPQSTNNIEFKGKHSAAPSPPTLSRRGSLYQALSRRNSAALAPLSTEDKSPRVGTIEPLSSARRGSGSAHQPNLSRHVFVPTLFSKPPGATARRSSAPLLSPHSSLSATSQSIEEHKIKIKESSPKSGEAQSSTRSQHTHIFLLPDKLQEELEKRKAQHNPKRRYSL